MSQQLTQLQTDALRYFNGLWNSVEKHMGVDPECKHWPVVIRKAITLPAGQSRRASFMESIVNVAVGFGIAMAAQLAVFPLFGIHIPFHHNLAIGAIMTVVSIGRSYSLRRLFNWWHQHKEAA